MGKRTREIQHQSDIVQSHGSSNNVINSVEEILSVVNRNFNVLENVLLSFKTRNIMPKWTEVLEACAAISQNPVNLGDVCKILSVFPNAYIVSWEQYSSVGKRDDYELTIAMNVASSIHILSESSKRKMQFSELAIEAIHHDVHCFDVPNYNLIPTKPVVVKMKGVTKKTTPLFLINSNVKSTDLNAQTKTGISAKKTMSCNSLDEVREMVKLREISLKQQAEAVETERREQNRAKQLKFLSIVCDFLHSRVRTCSTMLESDCMQKIVASTRCKQSEARQSISRLHQIVPEFVTILPPDDLVRQNTIKLNELCDYKEVRTKVLKYIQDNVHS